MKFKSLLSMTRRVRHLFRKLLLVFCVWLSSSLLAMNSFAQDLSQPLFEYSAINHPVMGKSGMVASHNVLSSQIAAEKIAHVGKEIDAL